MRPESDLPQEGGSPRERIIGAAERCFDRYGVDKTTIEDIAAAAGLSRATVYRYFDGGRDEVILAVLFRDFQRLLPRLVQVAQQASSLADTLVDTMIEALRFIREQSRPELMVLVERMFIPGSNRTTNLESTPQTVFNLLVEAARPHFEQAQAAEALRPGVTLEDTIEFVCRILVSLLAMPGHIDRTEGELRQFLRTYLAGALIRDATAPAPHREAIAAQGR